MSISILPFLHYTKKALSNLGIRKKNFFFLKMDLTLAYPVGARAINSLILKEFSFGRIIVFVPWQVALV
jgi:hypothetical protein